MNKNDTQLAPRGQKYNWPAAFLAWMRGSPMEDISMEFGMSVAQLNKAKREQKWDSLQEMAPVPQIGSRKGDNEHLNRCLANREKNYAVAELLREDVLNVARGLLKGSKLKRYFNSRDGVVEHDVDWNMQDRVALANYATMVANLGYRALGDREASTDATSDKPGGSPPAPSITLILPGCISNKREDRPVDHPEDGVVVDLDKAFGGGAPHGHERVSGRDGDAGGKALTYEAEVVEAQDLTEKS